MLTRDTDPVTHISVQPTGDCIFLKNPFVLSAGALGALAAAYLVGALSLGSVFAQTQTTTPSSGASEQGEAAALASQAKITADQANAAALAQFPAAAIKATELDSENGTVVYSVKLTDSAGKAQDVKVDATSGQVLPAQAEAAEANGTPEATESGGGAAD